MDRLAGAVLKEVEAAIVERNSAMQKSDRPGEIARLNIEMFIVVRFTDLVLVPRLG